MDQQIPERDWKQWRRISALALEAFCARVVEEAATFAKRAGSAHSRYLELWQYMRERDEEMASIFDDQRRSNAYLQMARAISVGVVPRTALSDFSDESRAVLERMLEPM
jgi:hypothetical protein